MFTKQHLNKKRCNECKRRKKKCQISNGDSCLYCLQRGVKCSFPDAVLGFDPASGKIHKKEKTTQNIVRYNRSEEEKNYITNLMQQKLPPQLHLPNQTKFLPLDNFYLKIFLPLRDSPVKKNGILMVNDDKISVNVLNKDMLMFNNFVPSTYVISSLRVKDIKYQSNPEKDRKIIQNIAKSALKNEITQFFKRNNIPILEPTETKPQNGDDHDVVDIRSVEDINLKVDFKRLKNVFMIEEPAIATDSNNKKFNKLPSFIDAELASSLFTYFCNICGEEFDSSSSFKISILTVCFPLILGNLTTLNTVLLWSYYHKLHSTKNDENLIKLLPQMRQLHLNTLYELSKRLTYYLSVSCDHTLFCVFLFMSVEVINGAKGVLWERLQNLAQSMISLRGGVKELCQTLTGDCIMKLLVNYLCTEVNIENFSLSFGFSDLKYVCEHNKKHEFFDNLLNKQMLTLNDIRNVVEMYFRVSILRSLLYPSLGLVNKSFEDSDYSEKIDYDSISESNVERIMHESSVLEMDIKYEYFIELDSTTSNNAQVIFASKACMLYLFQTIYKQSSLSPKTILLVKSLKEEISAIFEGLKMMTENESRQTVLFILPIFCYGIDLVGSCNRLEFINELECIYQITRKEMLKSATELLQLVWERNAGGRTFVDWKFLSKKHQINISLCC